MRCAAATCGFVLLITASAARAQNDDQPLVSAQILDAGTGQVINAIRVLAGTPFGVVNSLEDPAPAVWQPHTIREFRGGRLEWPARRAYELFRLRIEADGYVPVMTQWIRKADGPRSITIKMQRDPGVEGRVLLPEGRPAAGAMLVVTMPNRGARLENGRLAGADAPAPAKLSDRWRRPVTATADEQGRFRLTTEFGPVMVYAIHDAGIAEVPFEKLAESPTVWLEAWGEIDGRVTWLDKAGPHEELSLSMMREAEGYPEVFSLFQSLMTDAQGRFHVARIPPWSVQIARRFPLGDGPRAGAYLFPVLHVDVAPGRPTDVVFGGRGRPVVGRLVGLDSPEGVTLGIAPNAPRPADESGWRGHAAVRQSHLGPIFFRTKLPVEADGTFRIDHVLPAHYQLFVTSEDRRVHHVKSFTVKAIPGGQSDDPQNLGEIRVVRRDDKR